MMMILALVGMSGIQLHSRVTQVTLNFQYQCIKTTVYCYRPRSQIADDVI